MKYDKTMKYENKVFKYLDDYFYEMTENKRLLGVELDSFFEVANALYTLNKISLEENDLLVDSITDLIQFVIKVISTCPQIQHIASLSKEELEAVIKEIKMNKGD